MGDKLVRRKAQKLEQRKQAEYQGVIEKLMSDPAGRAFIYTLLERSRVGHNPFTRTDTDQTAFNCGELNIGLQLQNDVLTYAPGGYIKMLREAEDERHYVDNTLGSADSDNPQRDFFGEPELPAGDTYSEL